QDSRIQYRHASAENLPFPTSFFNLVIVALAFHWFHRSLFLAEASRVLRAGGHLIIYNGGLVETPQTNFTLKQWYAKQFLTRFPVPPNYNRQPLTQDEAQLHAFQLIGKERYTLPFHLSPETFVQYLMSMSLVTAMIEQEQRDSREVEQKLFDEVKALWSPQADEFLFGGFIEYWQKDK
ncbi:MAG TPA: class I SAM-dependent methyltransferase, partial [Ktedonobacteraceae bacterium]